MQTRELRPKVTAIAKPAGHKPAVFRMLITSCTVWLLLWLFFFDLGTNWVKPLRYVQLPSVIFEDQDPLDIKVQALEASDRKFNLLLLGSSLTAALSTADQITEKGIGAIPAFKLHTTSTTLDKLFRQQFSAPVQGINMGIDACMVEEDRLLLEKCLQSGHKPKMVLLLVAPRDFISNSHRVGSHVDKYFIDRTPPWQRVSFLQDPMKALEMIAQQSSIYKNRGNFRRVAELWACAVMHRAPNLFYAQQGKNYWISFNGPKLLIGTSKNTNTNPITKEQATEQLSKYYQADYIPVNYQRFDSESSDFRETLKNARAHGIFIVVVNMPRSQANDDILPAEFRGIYTKRLLDICSRSKAPFFNFRDRSLFNDDDFADGVHLSKTGAKKFFGILLDELQKNQTTREAIQKIDW